MKRQGMIMMMLLLSAVAHAQNRISYGLRGGLNISSISGKPDLTFYGDPWGDYYVGDKVKKSKSARPNFNVGGYVLYRLNSKSGFQTELYYSGEGYKGGWIYTYEGTSNVKFTDKYGMLNLPLLFKYSFTDRWYVMGGPQFSFALGAKHVQYPEGLIADILPTMKKATVGILPVVGYSWGKCNLDLRYHAGLTRLVKSQYTLDAKSSVVSVVMSYRLSKTLE